jgi:hypothetical protein
MEHDDQMKKGNKNPGQYGSTGGAGKGNPASGEDTDTQPGRGGGANRNQQTGSMQSGRQGPGSSTGIASGTSSSGEEDDEETGKSGNMGSQRTDKQKGH